MVRKKILEEKYIPKKPECIKLKFKNGNVPYPATHYKNVWEIRPIAQRVYDIWLAQMIDETNTNDKSRNQF